MDGRDLAAVSERASFLCSCFVILENAIAFVSRQSELEENSLLGAEVLLKFHTILNETFSSIVHLLMETSQIAQRTDQSSGSSSEGKNVLRDQPILLALVRVLGAWLAEDSLTLAAEVYQLLPYLLELCTFSTPQEEDADLLKFLLPGLCHLTADDKACARLTKAGLDKILSKYMQLLWPLCKKSR